MSDIEVALLPTEDPYPAWDDWFYKVDNPGDNEAKTKFQDIIKGYVLGSAYGIRANGLTVADGTVASGQLSTLTSASGLFASTHVGRTVTMFRMLQVTDGAITSGNAVLTSPGNQFPTWIVPGMTVVVSNAGVASQSLVTTVTTRDSAGQLTLANTANTTVSGIAVGVWAIHRTTISGYNSTTSVGLTAAAPFAFAGANVVWGTDDRAAFDTAALAARLANKTLLLPAGNILVALDATNAYGTSFSSDTMTIRGVGSDATRFYFAMNAIPPGEMALVRAGINGNIDIADFACFYYGVPFTVEGAANGGAIAIVARDGTAGQTLRARNIVGDESFPMMAGLITQAGVGTADSRVHIDDCKIYARSAAFNHFANTGTDARGWVRNSHLQTDYPVESCTDDSQYNNHTTYVHGHVGIWWENVTLKLVRPTTQSAYHLHNFGGPTGRPPFHMFINVETIGTTGLGILTHPEAANMTTVIGGHYRHGWTLAGGASFYRSRHAVPNAHALSMQGTGSADDFLLDGTIHDLAASTVGSDAMIMNCSDTFKSLRVRNPVLLGMPAAGAGRVMIGVATSGSGLIEIEGVKFAGDSARFDTFCFIRQGFKYHIHNNIFSGTWQGAPGYGLFTSQNTTVGGMELWLHDNDFDVVTPVIFDAALPAADVVRGSGNIFRNGVINNSGTNRRGHLEPPDAMNPTTVTSASATTLDWNYRTHRVGGSATIADVHYGGTAAKNVLFGGVCRLIVDAGSTWTTASSGNIVPLTTGARTVGTVVTLVWDAVAGKWHEV